MPRMTYTVEQIIAKLREAEVALSQGQTVVQVRRSLGITEQTYYRWRNEYGGLKIPSGEAAEGPGAGERAAQASGGGADA